jgi:hypothetical protein
MVIASSIASAININNETNNYNFINLAIAKIKLSETSTLDKIIDHSITILDRNETYVTIFVTDDDLIWLKNEGLNPEIIYKDYADMMGWKANPSLLDNFHTYSQMTTDLQDIADTYPDIAQLYNLGSSVQGRTIWGLKITDNPLIEENEPEVRICGCHHGNEVMGVELSLNLAHYMVENYDSDPYIQDLVDNRETWIIPMVNPDGRESLNRENAHGVDLNRDYGYMWSGEGGSPGPFSQPETQTIRNNAMENNFVLSLSYHTSANYINYVWNYKHQRVPDNDAVVYLSQIYGEYNDYIIIEGYDWYQTKGDTNDFSYGCRGDIDWTIETENSNIPYVWEKNRYGMLDLISAANMGLTGIVTDSETGLPIAATIWVEEVYWPCFTDPIVGDYHKPLLPGTYNVIIRANGYEEQEHQVVIDEGEPTVLDVELSRGDNRYAYQVTWVNFFDTTNYQNNPTEAISALGPPDGSFASLGVGGTIVLDMGEAGEIFNSQGDDFKVYEGDATDDGYTVYVSEKWDGPWNLLGTGSGTTAFDLGDKDIYRARFLKIKDDGNGSPSEQNPGFDLDAIENLNPTEVFVDQDFNSSTPGWGYDHFNNIQEALDVVAGLGTITVNHGIYNTHLLINKTVNLFGEDSKNTVINCLTGDNVIEISSNNVIIKNFNITTSSTSNNGIEIRSDYNLIIENNLVNNNYGITLTEEANYNYIYHDNFMDNINNAQDLGFNNQWDNNYPSGGNYWDDYTGSDGNGDGIGDIPYPVLGGNSEDRYPLIKPIGGVNTPPNKPTITGPPSGVPGTEYEYTIVSTDPDEDDLSYSINWGDGFEDVIGEFSSGTPATASHTWLNKGTYLLKVKAFDIYGGESDWEELKIKMPSSRLMINPLLKLFIQKISNFNIL